MSILEKLVPARMLALMQRRFFITIFILGLLSGLAMPPVNFWWILGITFPLFCHLLECRGHQSFGKNFLCGWVFSFGYFAAVLHWIGFAFLVDAANDLWMMPFAIGALAGGMALFWALAIAGSRLVPVPAFLSLPIFFGIAEWLRGHVLTGFPWAVPGLAVDGMGGVAQLAAVIGMNGLTVIVVLWALALGDVFSKDWPRRLPAIIIIATIPLSWAWGQWRIAANPIKYIDGIEVRLVQPNISQNDKWRGDNSRAIFNQLLDLSSRPAGTPPTVIVWPESALPFLLDESVEGKRELQGILGGGRKLLTGAVRRSSPEAVNGVPPQYYTSILAYDSQSNLLGHYDKRHLVPGGEFLPLAWLIEPLGFRKVVRLPESFDSGVSADALLLPGLGRVEMQICYEAIFPDAIWRHGPRPDWILNVTNDGWFGNSSGPYQHLAQLRLRAIEQGIGVVRVANTGVSAIIDATGGYIQRTPLGVETIVDSQIPRAIDATVYGNYGDTALAAMLILLAIASGVWVRFDRKTSFV